MLGGGAQMHLVSAGHWTGIQHALAKVSCLLSDVRYFVVRLQLFGLMK